MSALPEGLHTDETALGTVEIRDAQDIVWVSIHPVGLRGDPDEWFETIVERVCEALDIEKEA